MRRLVYVAFFLEVGLLLIVLPWSTFWERNYFPTIYPAVRAIVTNNFVRGAVSGVGFVNLVAGFFELLPMFGHRERQRVSIVNPRRSDAFPHGADSQVDP
jgi:hypothetical protein